MGSYVLCGDGIRPQMSAGNRKPVLKSKGILKAGSRFGSPAQVISELKARKHHADTGHWPDCQPLYPGGFCEC
jgi:hypothetical protein